MQGAAAACKKKHQDVSGVLGMQEMLKNTPSCERWMNFRGPKGQFSGRGGSCVEAKVAGWG